MALPTPRPKEPPAMPPRFIRGLIDMKQRRDDQIKLDVKVSAYPPAEFTWFLNNREITLSERVSFRSKQSTLDNRNSYNEKRFDNWDDLKEKTFPFLYVLYTFWFS